MTFVLFGRRDMNPANPKVGALVPGVTFFEGWGNLRVLDIPGVNLSGGWPDSTFVTPDGRYLYFAYTALDYSALMYEGVEDYSGPLRAGMPGPGKFRVFVLDLVTGQITIHPANVGFDPNVHVASPGINRARDLFLAALWDSADGPDSQLAASRLVVGAWTPLALVPPLNTGFEDDNPCPDPYGTPDMYLAYLASNRDNPLGHNRIWQTIFQNGAFLPPGLTPGLSRDDTLDDQLSVSPNNLNVFFTSIRDGGYGIHVGDRDPATGIVSNVRRVAVINSPPTVGKAHLIGEASVAEFPAKFLMYCVVGLCTSVDPATGQANGTSVKICVMSKAK